MRELSATTEACGHWVDMSVTTPGSSTRSQRSHLRIWRRSSRRCGPSPQMRSRQSGIWSATWPKASTSLPNCFSAASRPAVMMSGSRREERAAKPSGSGLGITTVWGVDAPSCSWSQASMLGVSSATTSARGAKVSSGSRPDVRSLEERCSWCTTTTRSGVSSTPQASRPGVTVTSTSTSSAGSAASRATSHRAVNCASQRAGTSTDSRACRAAASGGRRSPYAGWSGSRTSTRCWTVIRRSMS